MAKSLIPEELDALVQEYLTDGVLTDKERAVILKKAEGMGLDRDEIGLYLDAQIQKLDQAADAVVRQRKSKACPYCGAPVPQLTDKCPECGQFITPEASKELQDILEHLEEALVDFKSGKDLEYSKASVERYSRKAELYFSNNPKIKILLEEVQIEMEIAEKHVENERMKKTAISLFKSMWFWAALFKKTAISLFKSMWFWAALFVFSGLLIHFSFKDQGENFGLLCFLIGVLIAIIRFTRIIDDYWG